MIKKVMEDYKVLLRSIPAATVSLFFVSVIMMNLLANKELISLPYLALDCGFVVSWVSFLCQDMICKRFGAKASIKISILALAVNLAVSLCFWACSLTPGMWGAYYDTGMIEVNTALNATIGGTWYVVLGSSLAMFVWPVYRQPGLCHCGEPHVLWLDLGAGPYVLADRRCCRAAVRGLPEPRGL